MRQDEPLLRSLKQCPGCKCMPREDDGPPIRHFSLIAIVMLCNALPISILFPYIYFLVRDFHVAETEEDIGFYAGWVGASFMIGRCFTGILWGMAADHYGRKPVMIAGVSSVLVFNTLFGFSAKFWMAIVSRFCLGSMNGMLGTIFATVSELSSTQYQSLGLGVVSTIWGLGLVAGPVIGGFLSEPAVKYPTVFKADSLFARFPYLMPPLFASAFSILGLIACYFLPETMHNRQTCDINNNINRPKANITAILRNKVYMRSIMLVACGCLHDVGFTEIFSLWAVRPKEEGGFSFSSSDIGKVLAISAVGMLVTQLGVFPRLTRRCGPILVCRVSAGLSVPVLVTYLFMPKLKSSWLWPTILVASTLKLALIEAAITSGNLMINNSVKQEERGTANGISTSLLSLFKAIGPAAGGSVFAWSQKRMHATILPGNQLVVTFLNFWLILVMMGTFL